MRQAKPLSKQKALEIAQRWANGQLRKYDSIDYLCCTLHEKLILDWSEYWKKINRAGKISMNSYLAHTIKGEFVDGNDMFKNEVAILTRLLVLQDFINDTYKD